MLQDIIGFFNPIEDVKRGRVDFKEYYDKNLPTKEKIFVKFDAYTKLVARLVKPLLGGEFMVELQVHCLGIL